MNLSVKRLPAEVFHPSEYIRDELEARGWSVEQFTIMAGLLRPDADALVDGSQSVTPRFAVALALAFGTSATTWYRLQRTFDAGAARQHQTKGRPC